MQNVKDNINKSKLVNIGAILLFLFLFLYCAPTNSPEGITKEFLERLNEFNFESAKEISTDEGMRIVQMINNYYNKFSKEELENLSTQFVNSEIEVISIKEENETAIVEYKIDESDIEQMELRKVNGKWKANYKKPILEKISVDISQVYTLNNAYGQTEVSYSKNDYPMLEYFWDGAFLKYSMANLYLENIGSDGDCELIISETKHKQTFSLKANTSYILRVKPWNIDKYLDNCITLEMDKLILTSTQKSKLNGYYDITLEELPKVSDVDSSNLPDKKWFNNTIWEYRKKYCVTIEYYIKLRSDGLFGYISYPKDPADVKPEKFKFDGNDKWTIRDGFLYLDWNGGYATVKYKLTNKNTDYFLGTHSNSTAQRMLYRINQ